MLVLSWPVRAQTTNEAALATVVVTATALPGTVLDRDKVPGNVQVISASDLSRDGRASLTDALDANLSSIHINDNLDDPFQPDILYRGFEASPVLGTPQGLAVYQNGVRINEAFGDTVNWDLIPDIAVQQIEVVSSSPLYGLNALGGAVAVTMKNGFTDPQGEVELSGGAYGERAVTAQYGGHSSVFGFYVAGRALDGNGWRAFSDDRLRDLYAVSSLHFDQASVDLSYSRAYNTMQGQGPAPVQELAVNRALVFTGPQATLDRLDFLTLNGNARITGAWSSQAVLYYRNFAQALSNGNTTDYTSCAALSATLCQPDGVTPLTNSQGEVLPDISDGGARAIGENDFESIRTRGRGGTLQFSHSGPIAGHDDRFSAGAAFDYASSLFFSGSQLGLLNSQLQVQPSNLVVYTPENVPSAIGNGDPTPLSLASVTQSLGAFLTDTIDLSAAFAATASVRYNLTHIDLADQRGGNLSGTNRFAHFNPAIGATYRLLRALTLYGGESENTRTPTASEIECSNPARPCLLPSSLAGDPPNLREVVARTTELGVRGRIASGQRGELDWNLGVFRTLLEDDIYGVATSLSQGFFRNIGDTRREGVEAGVRYGASHWSGYLNYSLVQATFRSSLVVPSPSNPYRDALGDLQVVPGDRLPGIPEHRVKLGLDYRILRGWSVGTTLKFVSSSYYSGDESNRLPPIPGYAVVNLHSTYQPVAHVEVFASIDNLFDRRYATFGILSDPSGIGAPGIPGGTTADASGVDPRFQSPAAPFEAFGGIRLRF